jgi:hypothetical protein
MNAQRSTRILLILLAAAAALAGCDQVTIRTQEEPPILGDSYTGDSTGYMPATSLEGPAGEGGTEGMMAIQEKYSKAMEQLLEAQQERLALEKKNIELSKQLAKLQKTLLETEEELTEANEKLFEMRSELTRWKKNVLGFQGEMQAALVAIMKSQERILKLLGAEEIAVGRARRAASSVTGD